MKESDVTDAEVGRIRACEKAFKRATDSLLGLEGNLSGPLFEASSVGDVAAFTVLKRACDVIHDAKPITAAAYCALVKYRKEMEQVQIHHPGLVVTYPEYLGDALREAATIDLEALQASATAVGHDTTAFAPLSEAVKRANYYRSYGDI